MSLLLTARQQVTSVLLLCTWFVTSIYFNHLTPDFQLHLTESLDITMVELLVAAAYGIAILPLFGLRLLPPNEMLFPMAKIGFCHLVSCRFFIIAVCGTSAIPVSIAQTIRAASPIFMVALGYLYSGKQYSTRVLLSLLPLLTGFSIAALSELELQWVGFCAAVGSVAVLVLMSLIAKDQFSAAEQQAPHWAQVQLWSVVAALLIQTPTWLVDGGLHRVTLACDNTGFLKLVVLNGAMYYMEQVMQYHAIQSYQPLSYSVIDTLRRLCIVVVTGFFLRGDLFNTTKCAGILIVCGGAVYYNMVTQQLQPNDGPPAKTMASASPNSSPNSSRRNKSNAYKAREARTIVMDSKRLEEAVGKAITRSKVQ